MCCPDGVWGFAIIGAILTYGIVGWAIYLILNSNNKASDSEAPLIIAFWPIILLYGILYLIGLWVLFPLIGATKKELTATENRLDRKINNTLVVKSAEDAGEEYLLDSDYDNGIKFLEDKERASRFKIGDLITGKPDNPGNYKHYYKGCVARILNIDNNRQHNLRVKMIGHIDQEANKNKIGVCDWVKSEYMDKIPVKAKKKRKTARKKVKGSKGKKRSRK